MKFRILVGITILCFISCTNEWKEEYTISDIALVPECIDYSGNTGLFYLSSIAQSKIITLDPVTAEQNDFIRQGEYGFMPGVGLWADDKTNTLYALGGYYRPESSESALYLFDLEGRGLKKYISVLGSRNSFLNDLALDRKGRLFITDSQQSSIYTYTPDTDSLHLFFKSDEIIGPNGIAFSEAEDLLYVASFPRGVRVLDMKKMEIINPRDTLGLSRGIDGLEFYRGDLYAVQNGSRINTYNFRRLILDESGTSIISSEVLWQSHTQQEVPLTFCIVNGTAYLIRNSNIQYLNQENFEFDSIAAADKTVIQAIDLKKE